MLLLIVEMAMVSVIKIEPPGGEMWRKNGLPATGVDKRGEPFTVNFESINRGKESLVLPCVLTTHFK